MTVGLSFTKIGRFIEKRQGFMMSSCNCAMLANFEDFKPCSGGRFYRHSVYRQLRIYHTNVRMRNKEALYVMLAKIRFYISTIHQTQK